MPYERSEQTRKLQPLSSTVINVGDAARVFIIEDNRERMAWFKEHLGKRIVGWAIEPERAVEVLDRLDFQTIDLFFFDHDLGGEETSVPFALHVSRQIDKTKYVPQIIIHTVNPVGARILGMIFPKATICAFGLFSINGGPRP